jgi:four helix bundle protein
MEAAATSIPMNIAEGKGRSTSKELIRFMIIARGSLYEVMTLLEIFKKRNWITEESFNQLEKEAVEITKMINSFNKSLSIPKTPAN